MSAIPMGRAMPVETPRKRSGALWAHESTDNRGRLPLPMAIGAAALLTLVLGVIVCNVQLGSPPADTPPIVTQVAIVDTPPEKTEEPPPPTPEPSPPPPAPTPPVPRKIVPTPPRPTPAPTEQPVATPTPSPSPVAPLPPLDNLPPTAAGPVTAPPQAPHSTAIGVVCPTQVKPELPRAAARDGITGTVRARALIQSGVVKEVTVLSGPKVFHNAVRAAMSQYRCQSSDVPVTAEQEFVFQLD